MTTIEHAVAREAALDSARGWVIVTLGVCMLTLIWGIVFTFTVYADRLAATFGLTAVQVSSVFSTTSAALLAIGGLFGVFAARVTLRPVLALVAAGLAVSIALLQIADSFAGVVLAFVVLGTAGGTAFTIIISLAPQWFDEYQGLAMSITMTGVGLGPLVMPQAWLWLFERTSFQTGFAAVVGLTAVFVGASSLVYRRPPGTARDSNPVGPGWVRRRLSDRHFLSTAVGFPLVFTWFYVLSAHLVDILTANSIGMGVAAAGISIIGGVSVVTRIAGGYVGDRVGLQPTFLASAGLAGVCALVLPFVHSTVLAYAALFGFGIALGPLATLWSPIILTAFGQENATATVGLLNVSTAGFALVAPTGASVLHRVTGGWVVPLVALGIVTILGLGFFYSGTGQARV